MNEYYIYIHLHPFTNEVFYVGKGKGNRITSKSHRNKYWSDYVNKLGGNYKTLIVKDKLSEIEALQLEKKIIKKFDWHYADKTTNIEISFPDLNDPDIITLNFSFPGNNSFNSNSKKSIQFQNSTDKEIIETLLFFPNEENLKHLQNGFLSIYNNYYDNYDELDENDSDLNYEIEISLETIKDLFQEYNVSDKENISDFITDLKREQFDILLLLEQKPKGLQKDIICKLQEWVEQHTNAGNNI